MSRAVTVENDEHTKISARTCSLIGRLWADEQHLESLQGPSVKLWWTDEAIAVGKGGDRRGNLRSRAGRLFQHPNVVRDEEKRRGGSNGGKQGGDGSCTEKRRRADTRITLVEGSEIPDSDSREKRSAKVDSSSEHPLTAVVEVASCFIHGEDMDGKLNE